MSAEAGTKKDNGNGRNVPEKHLKRETEDGTYEIRETRKEDSKICMCRIRVTSRMSV